MWKSTKYAAASVGFDFYEFETFFFISFCVCNMLLTLMVVCLTGNPAFAE